MLTGFTFCIPLKNKTAEEVVKAYLNHICCVFGPSKKILTDNGTELKNKDVGRHVQAGSERKIGSHRSTHLGAMAESKDSTGFSKPQWVSKYRKD